jgi:hypothetical protein
MKHMSEVSYFCVAKQKPCPALQFGRLLGEAPDSFELRDITSQTPEELAPCTDCPFPTISRTAGVFKELSVSGTLARLFDEVIEGEYDPSKPVEPCTRCPQFEHQDKPDDLTTVPPERAQITMLEHHGKEYFEAIAASNEAINPFVRLCKGRVESKLYDDYDDGPTRIVICGAAALAAASEQWDDEKHVKVTVVYQ